MNQAEMHRICDIDRAYTVLMDQLQDAYDDEFRLKEARRTDPRGSREFTLAQERVRQLIEQITDMMEHR